MPKILKSLAVFSLALLVASCVAKVDQANSRHGRVVYRSFCGSCHAEGAEAAPLDTRSKTMAQWRRYFDKDRHGASPAVWAGLSEEDMRDVRQYVNDYAGDTDPAKCGSCWDTH